MNNEKLRVDSGLDWEKRFAKRAGWMRRSAVREFVKVTARPQMISFAGGLPAAELFPLERVREATAAVLERVGAQALQYGETEGVWGLREWIAKQFTAAVVRPENVLITTGAQQALDLVGRVLLDEGDRVTVENPTYLALLSAWRAYGVEFVPISSDEDGINIEHFEAVLARKPKLVYLVPNFQNPQGTTLSANKRSSVLKLLHEASVPLVEDNPYGELRYEGCSVPHLIDLEAAAGFGCDAGGHVIYTGTFSKVLMPGLRVGWVIAPEPVIEKMVQAKQGADLHTSTFNQYLALELVNRGLLDEFLPVLRRNYRERRDVMLDSMRDHFPSSVTWTRPEGGMFLMVKLPEETRAAEVASLAIEAGVACVPGDEFHLTGEGRNTLRLNFSNAKPAQIEEGIKRLGGVLTGLDALQRSKGPALNCRV